jgi:hypothetical protein
MATGMAGRVRWWAERGFFTLQPLRLWLMGRGARAAVAAPLL